MTLFQVLLKRGADVYATTLGISGHFVHSCSVIVVLQLPERLHGTIKIVVNDGKAVAIVLNPLPSRIVQVLAIVCQSHTTLQHIFASHWGIGVKIKPNNKISIIGEESSKLIINLFFVKLQLVKLRILKIKIVILITEDGSGV
mgnify:CR=1 FL=1